MSFIDYGFDIFSFGSRPRQEHLQSCGDGLPVSRITDKNLSDAPLENSCYHVIIDHLIDLGTYTENELMQVKAELEKYKRLNLSEEQIQQLKTFESGLKSENSEGLLRNSKRENYRTYITTELNDIHDTSFGLSDTSNDWNLPGSSLFETDKNDQCGFGCKCCMETSPRSTSHAQGNETPLSNVTFRETIIEKDSEIISLKTENAAKEAELKELEEQNNQLRLVIEKLKNEIQSMERSSQISQTQINDAILKKNEEIENINKTIERLKQDLRDERHARMMEAEEMIKLQTLVQDAQVMRKNLTDEIKLSKRRIETLETSAVSQTAMIKQLQQERDNLDKQNCEQENEIEKLLTIIKRLNEKYDRCKNELANIKDEIDIREKKLEKCREEIETTEQEVSKLISDLTDCLRRTDCLEKISLGDGDQADMYAKAHQLTRGLNKFVREHEKCHAHKVDLMKEINRLGAITRARGLARPICDIEEVKKDASREIARLKRVVINADHYQAMKVDLKCMVDDLLNRIENRKSEKTAYFEIANEASLALEKLDKKINDHDVYRKCESFLLLELENLQEALDGAQKTINDLDLNVNQSGNNYLSKKFENERKFMESNNNYPAIESVLSKKILQRVQNSTQIVIRITSALRDDSTLKLTYNKKLESQLQQTLSALNEVSVEKCQLQNEVDKLKAALNDKSKELQLINEKMQSRCEALRQENENIRKQASALEKKLFDSRNENSILIKESDKIIDNLHSEVQNRESKLREYSKFYDMLNFKLNESNKMIEKLQNTIIQENMRKVDLDSFTVLHDRILELVKEKDELTEKISILESQLLSYERNNSKMQNNLDKILEDNNHLEKCIKDFKCESDRLEANLMRQDANNESLSLKCDEIVEKIEKFKQNNERSKRSVFTNVSDPMIHTLEKELKMQQEKVRCLQKELAAKEKEIIDKTKRIEDLNNEIDKINKEYSGDNNPALLNKRIEILNREKSELKNNLEQTLMKYKDKLIEMHKQYKHNDIELRKNHNESIKHLEAKYIEMMKEEEKVFNAQTLLQSLNKNELQELHEKICKIPYCTNNIFGKDIFDDQKKKIVNKNIKKPIQAKKDLTRNIKTSSASSVKPSSRQRLSSRETSSSLSIIIPEKDHPHTPISFRIDSVSKHK